LEKIIRTSDNIRLGVAFEHPDPIFKKEIDGVCYYPIRVKPGLRRRIYASEKDKIIIADCLKVIEDFKPDIIHVFGSEWGFGLVEKYVDIPVVIHMQGSLPPYVNASYPPGYNFFTQWKTSHYNPIVLLKRRFVWSRNDNYKVAREIDILKHCRTGITISHACMPQTHNIIIVMKHYAQSSSIPRKHGHFDKGSAYNCSASGHAVWSKAWISF